MDALDASISTEIVDDGQLLSRAARGDKRTLSQLYDCHCAALLAVSIRILGSRDDAEDLVHDVFLEAWQKADTFDASRGTVRTWLLLRTRSRALDRLRQTRARRERDEKAQSDLLARSGTRADGTQERGFALDRDALRLEEPEGSAALSEILAQIKRLPQNQREVVELSFLADMSCAEIAAERQIALGTVKSRLSSGVARLRRALVETERSIHED